MTSSEVAASTPGEGLRSLLDLARRQDPEIAGQELLARAVALLVPDEALILDRLAALGHVPVAQIWTRPHTGAAGELVLENASRVGRLAGVALPDLTPTYLGRLLGLGLVHLVPAGDELGDYFQALLAEPLVLRALALANTDGSTPRVVRQALGLTSLGAELVAAAVSQDLGAEVDRDLPQTESSTDEP